MDHPNDPGGETNFGITKRFARAKGYKGSMRELSLELAAKWYRESLWDRYRLDEVARYSVDVAAYLFDMSVNHGQWTRIAQNAVNSFVETVVDGVWGPKTHAAFVDAAQIHGARFLKELRFARKAYYDYLIRKNPKLKVFKRGWDRRADAN